MSRGDLVTARGELSFFEPAGNPGQFDAEAYYSSQKILFQLKNPTILEIREGPFSLEKFLHRLRRSLFQSYQDIFSPGDASVMATMSLGETGQTEKERKLLYQEGGIAHILAISGLHISLLGMGLYRGAAPPVSSGSSGGSALRSRYGRVPSDDRGQRIRL